MGACASAGSSDAGEGTTGSAAASPAASAAPKTVPTLPEEQQKTGEEDEHVVFASEGTLFQFDEQDTKTWRERGRGELRVNKARSGAQTLLATFVHVAACNLSAVFLLQHCLRIQHHHVIQPVLSDSSANWFAVVR